MNARYIDIHCHLDFEDYKEDFKEVMGRMEDNKIIGIAVGTDLKSSTNAIKLAEKYENIFACVGAHPADDRNFVFAADDFVDLVTKPKCVAIGECGLDYFRFKGNLEMEKSRQEKEFIKQIEFAIKYNKPLMLHIRDAYEDAYKILEKYKGKTYGNVHFFTGSLEWAKKFIALGFTISFSGVITFAKEYEELVQNIPLDKIHAETDSPFAAPIPHRGKRNEPSYVIEIVKKIAEIKGEDLETVRLQLLENARKMFGLEI
jgi:TatD DNase family protein